MKLLKSLASPKLAAVNIAVLLVLCLFTFIIPQQSTGEIQAYEPWAEANPTLAHVAQLTELDNIFASSAFAVLLALLGLNLIACTFRRLGTVRKPLVRVPRQAPSGSIRFDVQESSDAVELRLRGRARLWAVESARSEQGVYLVLDRTSLARLGSLVMHAGMILLIVGGIVSSLTRFNGSLAMTEGESLLDVRESYTAVSEEPRLGNGYSGAQVTLDALRFDYESGFITQAYAEMSFASGEKSRSDEAAVNRPATWEGKTFLLKRGGHAVALSVASAGTVLVPGSIVRLGEGHEDGSEDHLVLPDGRRLSIFTTSDRSKRNPHTERLKLTDPAARFTLDGKGPALWLRPGQSGELGDLTITVNEVRLWNEFSVRKDGGVPLVYLAFAVITLGAWARFGFGKTRLHVLIEPRGEYARLTMWGNDVAALSRVGTALGGTQIVTGLETT